MFITIAIAVLAIACYYLMLRTHGSRGLGDLGTWGLGDLETWRLWEDREVLPIHFSPRHPVTSSPRHLVTPSPRHPVTPSPRHSS